jgi:enamine deaminase RidA (YjgF/YER057c/UK114 family)
MKALIFLFFLSLGFSASAQKSQHIKYAASSDLPGASDAVIVDEVPLVHTTQFLPLDNSGKIVGSGDINAQINQVFLNIFSSLKQAGSSPDQIVKLNIYVRNSDLIPAVQVQINKRFKSGKRPALSFVAGELSHSDALISMDAIAVSAKIQSGGVNYLMPGNLSSASGIAQAAILPAGPVVYVSGQAVKGGLAEATSGTLAQLQATLVSLGLDKRILYRLNLLSGQCLI